MGFEVKGLKELQAKLKALPIDVSKRYMAQALKAGCEPILAQGQATAPKDTGRGQESLHITSSTRGTTVTASVKNTHDAYYMVMQESGWIPQKRYAHGLKAVRTATKIPGKHFLEKALEDQGGNAVTAAAASLKLKIEANFKK